MLDVVDADDRVIGQLPRAEVYARRLIHRCVFVLVRDRAGRVFVHRRTDGKLTYPGAYDMFVGGVVGAGETYDEAAVREATEELGVSASDVPRFRFRFHYRDASYGSWWSAVYELTPRRAGAAAGERDRLVRLGRAGRAGPDARHAAVDPGQRRGVRAAARPVPVRDRASRAVRGS
jgi:8-oxo-dGTP pyrophosphatase MutT (NUDIX family)